MSDAAARGCEVLLQEQSSSSLVSVAFKNGVEGGFFREAPRVGLSFVAGGHNALSDGSVELHLVGEKSGLSVGRASCVAAKGQRLPQVTVPVR